MKNNYIVAIISYKRAKTQLTYQALRNCGYNDDIYIFISDNDTEIEDYKKKYDNVIIYNKLNIYNSMNVDLYDNFMMLDNCTIARNAVLDYVRKHNFNNVIILDDDIKSFRYRFQDENKLKSVSVKNIKIIFDAYINYLNCSDKICCLSFAYPALFIGGLSGKYSDGYQHLVTQIFIMKSNIIDFKGTRNEDEILSNNINYVTLTPFLITQDSVNRASNIGGLFDDYAKNKLYTYSFYSVIHNLSSSVINGKQCTCSIDYNKAVPKIISNKYKK